jgi:hypothetical protein
MYPASLIKTPSVLLKTHSAVPAIVLFTVLFGFGVYAGNLFAATLSSSSSSNANVYASTAVSANGQNGANGKKGADGVAGSNGTASASVTIKTVVNGKVVQDISERKESQDGEGVNVSISGNVSGTGNSRAASGTASIVSQSVTPASFSQRGAAPAEVGTSNFSAGSGKGFKIGGSGFYPSLTAYFIHVALFFRV